MLPASTVSSILGKTELSSRLHGLSASTVLTSVAKACALAELGVAEADNEQQTKNRERVHIIKKLYSVHGNLLA